MYIDTHYIHNTFNDVMHKIHTLKKNVVGLQNQCVYF